MSGADMNRIPACSTVPSPLRGSHSSAADKSRRGRSLKIMAKAVPSGTGLAKEAKLQAIETCDERAQKSKAGSNIAPKEDSLSVGPNAAV